MHNLNFLKMFPVNTGRPPWIHHSPEPWKAELTLVLRWLHIRRQSHIQEVTAPYQPDQESNAQRLDR